MLEGLFQPMHLLVIFGIALLVFGPKKLPELGKGIGEGIRGFKSAMKDKDNEKPDSITAVVANDQSLTKGRIVGFGTEILFMVMLGLVVLGPKRLHAVLGHVARAKAELENATRGMKSQLGAELEAEPRNSHTHCSHKLLGDQSPILLSSPSHQRTT